MSNRRTTPSGKTTVPQRGSKSTAWLLAAVLLCVGVGLLTLGRLLLAPHAPEVAREELPSQKTADVAQRTQNHIEPPAQDYGALVEDDGRTLWSSPTDGPPLNLAYLPLGVQVIAVLRPAALAAHPEGEKVLDALGPLGEQAASSIQRSVGAPLEDIEQLVMAFQVTSDGIWRRTLIARGRAAFNRDNVDELHDAAQREHLGASYWIVHDRAYYWPQEDNEQTLVVTPAAAVEEIIELAGEAPPLRRDVERLLPRTDADRHATIVLAPNSLFNEGASMFDGAAAGLREPLFWFLGDELSAAALSLHWGENFFVELLTVPTPEASPERAARILAERAAEAPDILHHYTTHLELSPHSQKLVARLPAMVRAMATYTRSGFERDHAVLRCYLPAVAGHNLLMSAELALAESRKRGLLHSSSQPPRYHRTPVKNGPVPFSGTLHDRLQRVTSLRFPRDTLEAALEQLSADVGVAIVIRGSDLQAEGITKNQSFGIDIQNRPAEAILLEVLRLANPDKTATGPDDERQRLVYLIERTAAGGEQIVVTTRAAAAERGDELPAAFRRMQR